MVWNENAFWNASVTCNKGIASFDQSFEMRTHLGMLLLLGIASFDQSFEMRTHLEMLQILGIASFDQWFEMRTHLLTSLLKRRHMF